MGEQVGKDLSERFRMYKVFAVINHLNEKMEENTHL
jgi:hypothetical protein